MDRKVAWDQHPEGCACMQFPDDPARTEYAHGVSVQQHLAYQRWMKGVVVKITPVFMNALHPGEGPAFRTVKFFRLKNNCVNTIS